MSKRWHRATRVLALAVACLGAIYACSASDDAEPTPQPCTPGQQINCGCPGGTQGTQVCLTSGTGYTACECPDGGAGPGGNATTTTTTSSGSGGAGLSAGGGGAGGAGLTGGSAAGGNGTGGSSGDSCTGAVFPVLADLAACSGNHTDCNAGSGDNTGKCIFDRCFPNCNGSSCNSPYTCVNFDGVEKVCAALVPCGSRCNIAKGALCTGPSVCITTDGDTYGQCLFECQANTCPYDAGSYELGCTIEAGGDWFCSFVCDSANCPAEHTCATSGTPRECEPNQ